MTVLIANVPHPLDPRPDYVVHARWRYRLARRDRPARTTRWDAPRPRAAALLNTADFLGSGDRG